jgi:ribose/xylose/arabinose/galactoside ABC-type transport system permease subunit
MYKIKNFILLENPIILFLIGIYLIFGLLNKNMFSLDGLTNILIQSSVIGIMAVGMTFVIVSGGLDLSVGSLMAITSVLVSLLIKYLNISFVYVVPIGLFLGVISGIIIGIFVVYVKLPPFIITLGMLITLSGSARLISKAHPISGLPENFQNIFWHNSIFFIPTPIFIWIVISIIGIIIQKFTTFGRYCYLIGNNQKAAEISGININRVIILTYMISGTLASLAGIMLTARLNSGQALVGRGMEIIVIAAVVLGGTKLFKGIGNVLGTVFGTAVIGLIYVSLSFAGLSTNWQEVGLGAILIVAIIIDNFRSRYI